MSLWMDRPQCPPTCVCLEVTMTLGPEGDSLAWPWIKEHYRYTDNVKLSVVENEGQWENEEMGWRCGEQGDERKKNKRNHSMTVNDKSFIILWYTNLLFWRIPIFYVLTPLQSNKGLNSLDMWFSFCLQKRKYVCMSLGPCQSLWQQPEAIWVYCFRNGWGVCVCVCLETRWE